MPNSLSLLILLLYYLLVETSLIHPFCVAGVNFAVNLLVLDSFVKRQKIYLLIFSCFNSQAIHLDTMSSMSVDDFLFAFVRFTIQFSVLGELYCDNAIIFVPGTLLLSNLIASTSLNSVFAHSILNSRSFPYIVPIG